MALNLKRIVFLILFNSSLFILLIVGIQNSSKKSYVNFIVNKTVNLPVSFIIGTSFISGSIAGSILSFKFLKKS